MLVDPKQILVVLKSEKQKKKKKERFSPHFVTFSTSIFNFPTFLLNFHPFSLASFFPVGQLLENTSNQRKYWVVELRAILSRSHHVKGHHLNNVNDQVILNGQISLCNSSLTVWGQVSYIKE